jgi:hypothetical protein
MQVSEIIGGSLNIMILAVFYTVLGAFMSYILFHLFDDYGKEWEEQGILYQTADVVTELTFVGAIAFWTTKIIKEYPPVFTIHTSLDREIDLYISGLFFAFAMFMFLNDLTTKIKYVYEKFLKTQFVRMFPEQWSIMKMIFGTRKTESNKYTN